MQSVVHSAFRGSQTSQNNVMRLCSIARRTVMSGQKKGFMSSMTAAAPEEDSHFALILGKPGGGKGTISGKILKVSAAVELLLRWWCSLKLLTNCY
jgi:hypothetical protein